MIEHRLTPLRIRTNQRATFKAYRAKPPPQLTNLVPKEPSRAMRTYLREANARSPSCNGFGSASNSDVLQLRFRVPLRDKQSGLSRVQIRADLRMLSSQHATGCSCPLADSHTSYGTGAQHRHRCSADLASFRNARAVSPHCAYRAARPTSRLTPKILAIAGVNVSHCASDVQVAATAALRPL